MLAKGIVTQCLSEITSFLFEFSSVFSLRYSLLGFRLMDSTRNQTRLLFQTLINIQHGVLRLKVIKALGFWDTILTCWCKISLAVLFYSLVLEYLVCIFRVLYVLWNLGSLEICPIKTTIFHIIKCFRKSEQLQPIWLERLTKADTCSLTMPIARPT